MKKIFRFYLDTEEEMDIEINSEFPFLRKLPSFCSPLSCPLRFTK